MSQGVVGFKDNWSVVCGAAQYEGMKAILLMLGYTFDEDDEYDEFYPLIVSDDNPAGFALCTQGVEPEEHHFENIMDLLVFLVDGHDAVQKALEPLQEMLKQIDEALSQIANYGH